MSRSERSTPVVGGTLLQWPILLVMTCLVASLGITATGHWRRGAFAIGCTITLAGLLRAVLPSRMAGLLAVRSRSFDAVWTLAIGIAMLVLTLLVPHSRPM